MKQKIALIYLVVATMAMFLVGCDRKDAQNSPNQAAEPMTIEDTVTLCAGRFTLQTRAALTAELEKRNGIITAEFEDAYYDIVLRHEAISAEVLLTTYEAFLLCARPRLGENY